MTYGEVAAVASIYRHLWRGFHRRIVVLFHLPPHLSTSRISLFHPTQFHSFLHTTMPSILVAGASRGIGKGIAEHYAAAGYDVIATMRKPDESLGSRVKVLKLDVNSEESVAAAAKEVQSLVSLEQIVDDSQSVCLYS
jgi:short chain dehydrogenase